MNKRTDEAIQNMVRARDALKVVDQLHCTNDFEYNGVSYTDRDRLKTLLDQIIQECEVIVSEEDSR